MTLGLILTRHAKSDWGTPGLADFDRPLNDRGRRSARAIGRWLSEKGFRPDEVVLSGAARTRQTWELMAASFDPAPPVVTEGALYDASADTILEVLRRQKARKVLLIGHNPGIGQFANRLTIIAPTHPRFNDYPTGATTVFSFQRDTWSDVGWSDGEVKDFATPRDLTD